MKKALLTSLILFALNAQAESVFRRSNSAEPKSIDPQLASENAGSNVIYDTFEGLVSNTASGEITPGVAEKWEISEDGKTYTFHLRENAKWSNDTPVTAGDFVYAWRRAVNPATGGEYAFILYPVKNAEAIASGTEKNIEALGIKAIDAHTVQVELNNPTPYFLDLTAHYITYPIPQKIVEQYGDKWTQPGNIVSNGAYKLTKWKAQSDIVVEKSPTYWNKDQVSIDKVVYYPTESTATAFARYRAGEVDYVESLTSEDLETARKQFADQLHIDPYLGIYWIGFNTGKPPLKDNVKLREALSIAIDRQTIIDKITKAGQIPAYGLVPPATKNSAPYQPEYAKLDRKAQIERAKALYAEAGYSKEKPLKISLTYNTSEAHKKIMVAIAAMWKQVLGVETELVNQEWKVMLSNFTQGNIEAYRYGWIGDYNDPYTFLEVFQKGSAMNYSKFSNDAYDAKLKEASATQDLAARAKLLQEAEKMVVDDYAFAPLYYYVTVRLLKPQFKGYAANPTGTLRTQYLHIEP